MSSFQLSQEITGLELSAGGFDYRDERFYFFFNDSDRVVKGCFQSRSVFSFFSGGLSGAVCGFRINSPSSVSIECKALSIDRDHDSGIGSFMTASGNSNEFNFGVE